MARVTRQTFQQFGLTGPTDDFEQFGSTEGGSPNFTKVIATIQSLSAWGTGWRAALVTAKAPVLQDLNGVTYVMSYMLAYLFQDGIPEYDSATTYYIGGVVKNLGNSGWVEFYCSLTNANVGNALPTRTNNANWQHMFSLNTGTQSLLLTATVVNGSITFASTSTQGIVGTTTNDSAASGFVGEAIQSYAASVAIGTSNVFTNVTSINLTAGDWDVSGLAEVIGASGNTFTGPSVVNLSAFSGNTTTDAIEGDNYIRFPTPLASQSTGASIPVWRVSIAAPTTIYLKVNAIYSSATSATMVGRISARRVR